MESSAMSPSAVWGDSTPIKIPYTRAVSSFFPNVPSGIRTGTEADRSALEGLIKAEIATLSGGLLTSPRIHPWQTNLDKVYYSAGVQHHVTGVACHAYVLTSQPTLQAVDASGYRAANKRAHAFQTNLGQSKMRFGVAVGPYIFRTNSDLLHDLVLPTGGTLTDNIMAVAEGVWNSVRYMGFGTDGQTNDIVGFTEIDVADLGDVDAELVTLGAGDVCNGMANLDHLGSGFMLYYGRLNTGSDGLFYSKHADAIPITTLKRVSKTATRTVPSPNASIVSTG